MDVTVDRGTCAVTGICESLVPEVFRIDDSGELSVRGGSVPTDLEDDVRDAVDSCPTRSLRLS